MNNSNSVQVDLFREKKKQNDFFFFNKKATTKVSPNLAKINPHSVNFPRKVSNGYLNGVSRVESTGNSNQVTWSPVLTRLLTGLRPGDSCLVYTGFGLLMGNIRIIIPGPLTEIHWESYKISHVGIV